MAWDSGNAQAMPNTEEIGRPPPYETGPDEGKPPAYSVRPPSIPEPVHPAQSTRFTLPTAPGTAHIRKTPRKTGRKRGNINWCYWFRWILFAACICAGVFTGLFVGLGVRKRHNKSDNSAADPPYTPDVPLSTVYDLAATECEPGTFIFHQDMFGDVWIQGEFRNAMWMNTSAMAPLKLHFAGSLSPQKSANMTAVCWLLPGLDVVRIALYFVSPFPDPVTKYAIIETIIDIYTTNFTLVDYPAFSDTHNAIIRVLAASALTVVILPSEGVRLYYSDLPTTGKKIDVIEVSRGWPEPAEKFDYRPENSRSLNAQAYRTWTALTAAAVDRNDGTTPAEVHVFFVDSKSRLSRVVRKGSETWPAQPLTQRSTSGVWDIKIQKMIAIIPHITNGFPEPDLFFINNNNNKVTDIFGVVNAPTGEDISSAPYVYVQAPKPVGGDISGPSSIPQAVQDPPLIAVTCWNFGRNHTMGVNALATAANRERLQMFYVRQNVTWYDGGKTYENVKSLGEGIVKVTGRSDPYLGYYWNWNEASNET